MHNTQLLEWTIGWVVCRYEAVLQQALGRMSSLAVHHTRQAEVRDMVEQFDALLHKIKLILDTNPGAITSSMTNDKVGGCLVCVVVYVFDMAANGSVCVPHHATEQSIVGGLTCHVVSPLLPR